MLVAFTRPDGGTVEINPDDVASVDDADPAMYDPRGKTAIALVNGAFRVVRESRAEVDAKLGVK